MQAWGLFLCLLPLCVCPPPRRDHVPPAQQPVDPNQQQGQHGQQQQQNQEHDPNQRPLYEFTYNKYLEEVVKILENDPKFAERLKGMKEEDIKAGNIADHIDDLDDHVFERLTKVKLLEIERLREVIAKQIEAEGGAHNVKLPEHLDVNNWEKFGREDLRKLIQKTVADMNEMDEKRKEEFKEYELKRKAEEDHRLAQMNEEERRKAAAEAEAARQRHNDHEKLKHPGSRDQLEEVWEESDHLDKESFDPRTFFALHDLNGDGFWNSEELEALFQIELEKVYNDTNPDDDPKERMEEMYRMREHVVKQMDKNNDRLISLEEFLQDTEAQNPGKDEGWEDLGQQELYTDEELQKFEKEYANQQGWGPDAYHTTAAPVTASQPRADAGGAERAVHIEPVQVNHGVDNTVQQQVPPAQHQQPAQAVQPQAAQNQPPVQHQPIHEAAKDPSYGI